MAYNFLGPVKCGGSDAVWLPRLRLSKALTASMLCSQTAALRLPCYEEAQGAVMWKGHMKKNQGSHMTAAADPPTEHGYLRTPAGPLGEPPNQP